MIDFAHTEQTRNHFQHAGVARLHAGYRSVRGLVRSFTSIRGLSTMLLGAMVALLVLVADRVMDAWAEENLLMGWIALWAVAFFAMSLLAGAVRGAAARMVNAMNAWSARVARARADERLWESACRDPRIMAEIQQAQSRALSEAEELAPLAPEPGYSAEAARSANIDDEIEASHIRRGRALSARYGF
jgi:hypothetical protein